MVTNMNSKQVVADWLEEKNSDLASSYLCAVAMLTTTSSYGNDRTRVMLISHCMREVMNRLPTAVMMSRGTLEAAQVKRHRKTSNQVEDLPKLRSDFPGLDLTLDADLVPVPRPAALAFGALIDSAVYEDHRRRSDIAALLTDDGNPKHPAVTEWREMSRYFSRWAHLENEQRDVVPSDAELTSRISVFEDHVSAIRQEFFESKAVIEDLLLAANMTIDEEES